MCPAMDVAASFCWKIVPIFLPRDPSRRVPRNNLVDHEPEDRLARWGASMYETDASQFSCRGGRFGGKLVVAEPEHPSESLLIANPVTTYTEYAIGRIMNET